MFGSPGPCAPPSSTGAKSPETHHRRSPSPNKSGGAGDSGTHGRWHQRPGWLLTTGRESARGDDLAPCRPYPGSLMANTEGRGGSRKELS